MTDEVTTSIDVSVADAKEALDELEGALTAVEAEDSADAERRLERAVSALRSARRGASKALRLAQGGEGTVGPEGGYLKTLFTEEGFRPSKPDSHFFLHHHLIDPGTFQFLRVTFDLRNAEGLVEGHEEDLHPLMWLPYSKRPIAETPRDGEHPNLPYYVFLKRKGGSRESPRVVLTCRYPGINSENADKGKMSAPAFLFELGKTISIDYRLDLAARTATLEALDENGGLLAAAASRPTGLPSKSGPPNVDEMVIPHGLVMVLGIDMPPPPDHLETTPYDFEFSNVRLELR